MSFIRRLVTNNGVNFGKRFINSKEAYKNSLSGKSIYFRISPNVIDVKTRLNQRITHESIRGRYEINYEDARVSSLSIDELNDLEHLLRKENFRVKTYRLNGATILNIDWSNPYSTTEIFAGITVLSVLTFISTVFICGLNTPPSGKESTPSSTDVSSK